jgi:AraC family transcriptional regulator of adaptative response / DNA-3-methyladenine glycosylase II
MGQVALAAGFGCVRRFNAAIRGVYYRTPMQIRRLVRKSDAQSENQYLVHLSFHPPYNWKRLIEFLAARAMPGVEAVDYGCYRRSISVRGFDGYVEVSPDERNYALAVRVQFGDPRGLFFIIERVRAMFDLNADWPIIVKTLQTDASLARWIAAEAGLRVPGCWNGFELAVRAILGQQVSVKAATTLAGRIVLAYGRRFTRANGLIHVFPDPEILAEANLNRVGLTSARAESIRALARAVCDKRIRFEGIVDYDDFRARLCEIPGIGKWTAEYVAMRALRRPDAFPTGDLVLRRVLGDCSARELDRKSEAWRPWRAYAVMLLWQSAGQAVPSAGERPSRLASALHQKIVKSRDAAAAPFVRAGSARSRRIA